LQQQAAVEIEPQRTPIPFTRRVRHRRPELIPPEVEPYTETALNALKIAASSGKCGLKTR
jgi:hypothetical protein